MLLGMVLIILAAIVALLRKWFGRAPARATAERVQALEGQLAAQGREVAALRKRLDAHAELLHMREEQVRAILDKMEI